MGRFIIIANFILILLSGACGTEEDCAGCNMNPKIKVEFEPEFTLDLKDSLFAEVKTKIQDLVDSLAVELTSEQVAAIQNELVSLRSDSAVLDEEYSLLRSGKVQINQIMAPGSIGLEQFADSLITDFAIPIDMQSDSSTFYISYQGFNDTLQLHYKRNIIQNLEGVRMRITNIDVNEEVSTFDSLRVVCGSSECSNDQTTIYIYF